MKILYLLPYSPVEPTFGGALRIFHILNHLCKNYDVTVAGFCTLSEAEALISEFPSLKGKLYFVDPTAKLNRRRSYLIKSLFSRHSHWYLLTRSKKFQRLLNELLSREDFDIIQSEFPIMAMFNLKSRALKVLDAHNVEYDNFRRMSKISNPFKKFYYNLESRKFFKEEIRACNQQDAIFTTSQRDADLLNEHTDSIPKYVIANGVDVDHLQSGNSETESNSLVFVGMMKYVPNYDGMHYFLDEIFEKIRSEIPDCKIYIVGSKPPKSIKERAGENIIVTGFVEDIRPYVQKASVYVVPLRMGSGTRLKILEAFAMEKAVVTTSIGCEGLNVENEEHVLIADEPEKFADSVIELLRNKKQRKCLEKNGKKLAENVYDWKIIGKDIDKAFESLLSNHSMSVSDYATIPHNGIQKPQSPSYKE